MVTIKSKFEFHVQELKFRICGGLCRFYAAIGMYDSAESMVQKRNDILKAMWAYVEQVRKGIDV